MALEVEDGTGKTNADSFVSIADADQYFTDHGDPTAWSGATTADKEAALREATQYMDGVYRLDWVGERKSKEQSLTWPRSFATDSDGWSVDSDIVPQDVKNACSELALRALSSPLLTDVTAGGQEKRIKEKLGPLEREREYFSGAPSQVQYSFVNRLLSRLLRGGGGRSSSIALVRT